MDANGERFNSAAGVFLYGTKGKKSYTGDYEITSRAASVDISIRLMNATGSLEVGDLKLSKLSFNEGYVKLQFATFIVWGLVLAWLIALALQYATRMQLIGILVLMALAFVGTLLPPKVISTASLLIADLLPDSLIDGSRGILAILYGHDALTPVAGEIRKIGHFLVFLVLGFLVGFGSKKIQLFFAAASISVFALVTEVLQTLIYGRSPSTVDFIVDCVGGVIGLGIGVFAYVIARLYTKANTQSV